MKRKAMSFLLLFWVCQNIWKMVPQSWLESQARGFRILERQNVSHRVTVFGWIAGRGESKAHGLDMDELASKNCGSASRDSYGCLASQCLFCIHVKHILWSFYFSRGKVKALSPYSSEWAFSAPSCLYTRHDTADVIRVSHDNFVPGIFTKRSLFLFRDR